MSTTTVDTAATSKKPARTKKKTQTVTRLDLWRAKREQKRAEPGESRGWFSVLSWTVGLRLLVLLVDYVVVMAVATAVIPQVSLWLHQQSGVGTPGLLSDASIAMWLLPLASVVGVLVVGEVYLMRGLWRWATRRLDRIKGIEDVAETVSETKTTGGGDAGRSKKSNRKRS